MPSELPRPRPSRFPLVAVLVCVLCGALLQLAVIWMPRSDIHLSGKQRVPMTYHAEEVDPGTLALDLLEGRILGVLDYQHAPHFGGSVVVGLLGAPLFALFGPSVAALKLTTVIFKALATLFAVLILERFVSRRAAWIGGLLFACTTPGYTQISVLAWGTHIESNAFAMALVLLFMSAFAVERERAPFAAIFAAGVVAGLATYLCFVILVLIGLLAFVRCLLGAYRRLPAEAAVGISGFALGLTPWIVFNTRHGFTSLVTFEHALGSEQPALSLAERAARVRDLWPGAYARSFFMPDLGPLPGWVSNAAFALFFGACFAAAGLLAARQWRRARPAERAPQRSRPVPLGLLCAAFPLAFTAAYALNSGFKIGFDPERALSYRYVCVLYPFACLSAGIAAEAAARTRARRLVPLAAGLLALLAAAGHLELLEPANAGVNARIPGYSRRSLGRFLVGTYPREPELVLAALERAADVRSPEQLDELLDGMLAQLRFVLFAPTEVLDGRLLADRPYYEPLRAHLQANARPALRGRFELEPPPALPKR